MVEHKLVKQQRERNKQKAQAVKDLRKLKSEEAKLDAEMAKLTGYTSDPIIRYVEETEGGLFARGDGSPKATETIITSPQWNAKKVSPKNIPEAKFWIESNDMGGHNLIMENDDCHELLVTDNWDTLKKSPPTDIFEIMFGKICDWKNYNEKNIYNKIYKLIRKKKSDTWKGKRVRRDKYGNPTARAKQLKYSHQYKDNDGVRTGLKNWAEHDKRMECPFCFPLSQYNELKGGHDIYIKKIQKENMDKIAWAKKHDPQTTVVFSDGSSIKASSVERDPFPVIDDDLDGLPEKQRRYVLKQQRKMEAYQKEITNIKKKYKK